MFGKVEMKRKTENKRNEKKIYWMGMRERGPKKYKKRDTRCDVRVELNVSKSRNKKEKNRSVKKIHWRRMRDNGKGKWKITDSRSDLRVDLNVWESRDEWKKTTTKNKREKKA